MPVDSCHKQYNKYLDKWCVIRDVLEGHDAVKGMTDCIVDPNLACKYLPIPCGQTVKDCEKADLSEYCAYVFRAKWLAATQRTVEGLVGLVFGRALELNVPPGLEYVVSNVDGACVGIENHAKDAMRDVAAVGRFGLLVDYPATERQLTLAEERELGLRPKICSYPAESIVNWRTKQIGVDLVLTLLVLKEIEETPSDDYFDCIEDERYRVLFVNEDGHYESCQYRWEEESHKDAGGNRTVIGEWVECEGSRVIPVKADGEAWDFIPFIFVGAESNRPEVSEPPMLQLSQMNLAHYRNSADLEQSVYMVGQPTPWVSGFDAQTLKEFQDLGETMRIGSRVAWKLPENALAGMLQMSENQGAFKLMEHNRIEMIAMGAGFLEPQKAGVESAESQRLRLGSQHSVLSNWVDNVSDAYHKALTYMAMWLDLEEDGIRFSLNRDFMNRNLSSKEILELVDAWLRGGVDFDTYANLLRKGGAIDKNKTNEEFRSGLEEDVPGLGFNEGADTAQTGRDVLN